MKYKNNPFNIRYTNKSKWLGLTGSKNGFCEFSSIEYGVRCCLYLLLRTYKKRGWLTLRQIIEHFAPVSDHNNTDHYIWHVTTYSGLSADSVFTMLPKVSQFRVLAAMSAIETGYHLSKVIFDKSYSLL